MVRAEHKVIGYYSDLNPEPACLIWGPARLIDRLLASLQKLGILAQNVTRAWNVHFCPARNMGPNTPTDQSEWFRFFIVRKWSSRKNAVLGGPLEQCKT